MSIFKVNFRKVAYQIIPWWLRTPLHLRKLYSAVKPLKDINDNGTLIKAFGQANPSLFQLRQFTKLFTAIDARTIYLEKWLNLCWDQPNERIVINNNNTIQIKYLFNAVELADPFYMFNNWVSGTAYVASPEDYVHYEGFVYVCIANSTGDIPSSSPTFWTEFDELEYFFNKVDTTFFDFTVEVPLTVSLQPGYSEQLIIDQVKLFSAAGINYNILIV